MTTSAPYSQAGLSGRSVTLAAIAINGSLAVAKIVVGILSASQTILADGLHSGSDLVTDLAVLAGLKVSDKPADRCHPYGHRRVSTLVAMVVGIGLLIGACMIAYNAIGALHNRPAAVRAAWPLALAAATIPIKEVMFRVTRSVGRRSGNLSLLANAWHHRSDAFTSVAAAAGLAGVLLGGPGWAFLDAVMGTVLAAFVVVVAVRIMRLSASELIDRAPDAKSLASIEKVVTQTDGVQSHHAFRARKIGGRVAMDIHIQVSPALTVKAGHDIASAVRQNVMAADPDVMEVVVHIEPADPQ